MTVFLVPGEKIFPEKELTHLDGHKGSKPVRIGNGAIDHIQLVRTNHNLSCKADLANLQDIYGELCDEPLSPLVVKLTDNSLGWIVSILPKR
jgi:hypothetical protein